MMVSPRRRALGTTTALAGNILALTSVTLNTGAAVDGRVLAQRYCMARHQ
jgi:hypothetical protein